MTAYPRLFPLLCLVTVECECFGFGQLKRWLHRRRRHSGESWRSTRLPVLRLSWPDRQNSFLKYFWFVFRNPGIRSHSCTYLFAWELKLNTYFCRILGQKMKWTRPCALGMLDPVIEHPGNLWDTCCLYYWCCLWPCLRCHCCYLCCCRCFSLCRCCFCCCLRCRCLSKEIQRLVILCQWQQMIGVLGAFERAAAGWVAVAQDWPAPVQLRRIFRRRRANSGNLSLRHDLLQLLIFLWSNPLSS